MPRPRYRITPSDRPFASAYLGRQIEQQTEGFPGRIDREASGWVEALYHAGEAFQTSRGDADTLQAWCATYLSELDWVRLKNAIRDARRRLRERLGEKEAMVSTKLTREAWLILSHLATHEGLTLSEFIVSSHKTAWIAMDSE